MAKSSSGIDLGKLSLEELKTLAGEVQAEIESRRQAEVERVRREIQELQATLGISVDEILGREAGKGRPARAEAKYRHPDDPSLTWSGRGKRPGWVTEALGAGKTLDDLTAG